MIKIRETVKGLVKRRGNIAGSLKISTIKEYPKLEDIEITPSTEEKTYKSENFYGYNNVKVKPIISDKLDILPSNVDQKYNGLYNEVKVAGDSNLQAGNIAQGVTIFGVEGTGKISDLNTSDFRSCGSLFSSNKTLVNAPNMDTSNCNSFSYMFSNCDNLETVPNYNMDKCTTVERMFQQCYKLKRVMETMNTSNCSTLSLTFYNCYGLEFIPELDAGKIASLNQWFVEAGDCALTDFKGLKDIGKAYTRAKEYNSTYTYDLSRADKLTAESVESIIHNLYDLNLTYNVANGGTLYRQKIRLHQTIIDTLSDELKAEIEAKGWTLST